MEAGAPAEAGNGSDGNPTWPTYQGQRLEPTYYVAFPQDKWWAIPREMSLQLQGHRDAGSEQAGCTWDWGDTRSGSWRPDGEVTRINRYLIDFRTMTQRNLDNNRKRTVQLAWKLPSGPAEHVGWL